MDIWTNLLKRTLASAVPKADRTNTYPIDLIVSGSWICSDLKSDSKKIIIAGIKMTEKWPAAMATGGTSFKYFFIMLTLKPYKNCL